MAQTTTEAGSIYVKKVEYTGPAGEMEVIETGTDKNESLAVNITERTIHWTNGRGKHRYITSDRIIAEVL